MPRTKSKPRFSEKDKVDKLTIVEYLGWRIPGTGASIRPQHMYLTQCVCSETRTVTQDYLRSPRAYIKQCTSCGLVSKQRAKLSRTGKKAKDIIADQALTSCWKPPRAV